ncbi:MAG: putative porin [Acidobacteriales bacterium]|nr:putative porin [Terriglobales bacterium]
MSKLTWLLIPALSLSLAAQTTPSQRRTTASRSTAAASSASQTAEELRALREALAEQQRQIQLLREELRRRDQSLQQHEQQINQLQSSAREAESKAGEAQTKTTASADTLSQIQQDVADLKTNQMNAAISTQDDQKRFGALETLVNRFRLSGDVRVRYENFFESYDGCTPANCPDRHRARIRLRLGIDGKLNEDFIGAFWLATGTNVNAVGSFADPVSTNQTLTDFFERKTIGVDRGYISYQPQAYKWVQLTGGKFPFSWLRTPMTFDNDLNPEGFTEKFSFDFGNPVFKNVTVTAMQLLFNEISGIGTDGNALGGQVSGRIQLMGGKITVNPAITYLNWNGEDVIAQAAGPVLPCASPTSTNCIQNPNTTPVGTPSLPPLTPAVRFINANALTNATRITGTGSGQRRAFVSGFEYAGATLDTNIKTPFAKWPVRILLDYNYNLDAKLNGNNSPSKQDRAYWIEASVGQTRNKNDLQFGYSFTRIEQDALISQFNESDLRAATNVLNHRIFFGWAVQRNTTIQFTQWIGRTLNTNLQNAARTAGLAPGAQDPWLYRAQYDLIYRF